MIKGFKEKTFCGLDIGAQKIKAGILKAHDANRMELLGVYEQKTEGFDRSSVTDLGRFSECIYETISNLVDKTGVKVKSVQLGLGGELVEFRSTNTVIPISEKASRTIQKNDVLKINNQARLLGVKVEAGSNPGIIAYNNKLLENDCFKNLASEFYASIILKESKDDSRKI